MFPVFVAIFTGVINARDIKINEFQEQNSYLVRRDLLQVVGSQQCEKQLESFMGICALQEQAILIETNSDNQMSVCCWQTDCCDRMQRLVESDCIDPCQNNHTILELVALYGEVCHTAPELPKCGKRISEEEMFCDVTNQRIVEQCGNINGNQMTFTERGAMELQGAVDIEESCCELSKYYMSMSCVTECDSNPHGADYVTGNALAKFWAGACAVSISDTTRCEEVQWIEQWSASSRQVRTSSSSQELFKISTQPYVNEDFIQSNNYDNFATVILDQESMQCQQSQEQMKISLEFWNSLAFTFCGPNNTKELETSTHKFEICCEINKRMSDEIEQFQTCFDIESLQEDLANADKFLQSWQSKCHRSACPNEGCYRNVGSTIASVNSTSLIQLEENSSFKQTKSLQTSLAEEGIVPAAVTQSVGVYPVLKRIPMLSTFFRIIETSNFTEEISKQQSKGKIVNLFAPTDDAFNRLCQILEIDIKNLRPTLGELVWDQLLPQHMIVTNETISQSQDMQLQSQLNEQVSISSSTLNGQQRLQISSCCPDDNVANVVYVVEFQDCILWVIDDIIVTNTLASMLDIAK